jgi:hypothetical protein
MGKIERKSRLADATGEDEGEGQRFVMSGLCGAGSVPVR